MTKGRETRARVLDSAIALFNRKGFGNTSIQDIIDATGVKKGNLYFHFASKDDLCLSLLREAGDRFFKYLSKSIKSPDPLGKIGDILHAVLNYHRRMRFSGGCIFGNTALEKSDTNEKYAAFIRTVFTQWEQIFAGLLREAREQGELSSKIAPDTMARHIVAVMEGSIMMARLYKREDPIVEGIGYLNNLIGVP
ncbi:MAG: hypothetical protein A2W19_08145 [Spirochaetes bacterium RBG_16_49_21]|nr:MAG: hypothetical protein A2W19_08145 [Spirochaetes bacterium RBG_16_49_21]